MPKQLASPITMKTRLGSVDATHEGYNIQIVDIPDNHRIISIRKYYAEIDGHLEEIPNTDETLDIVGAELESLPDNFSVRDILEKHKDLWARNQIAQADAKVAQAKSLESQIREAEKRLADLKRGQ